MLVDACDNGTTIDQLRMDFLGIPLLEASQVVQELTDAVRSADAHNGGAR